MYALRKNIPLERVTVRLRHERIYAKDCQDCTSSDGQVDRIFTSVLFDGPELSEQNKKDLQRIANMCPVSSPGGGQCLRSNRLSGGWCVGVCAQQHPQIAPNFRFHHNRCTRR